MRTSTFRSRNDRFWRPLALCAASLALSSLFEGHERPAEAAKPPAPVETVIPAPAPPPPSRTVLRIDLAGQAAGGNDTYLTPDEAEAQGYMRVSLRDDWTPFIFREPVLDGQRMQNRYRTVFLGLAQDKTDGDGQPLAKGEKNYLELFGIPPAMSVLRDRFLADSKPDHACAQVDLARIRAVPSVPSREPKNELKERVKLASLEHELEARRQKGHFADLAAMVASAPTLADEVKTIERAKANRIAFTEVEKRLRCEGLLSPRARHSVGLFDDAMKEAVVAFQKKNKLYDAAALKPDTMIALGKTPLENDYDALVRTITERVVDAADILEDGSTDTKDGPREYKDQSGQPQKLRNLVDETVKETLATLGWTSPEAALAFFQKHDAWTFTWLEVAVKKPTLPPWYGPNMDLSVEVDRGDVIYDPLYDEKGHATDQTRHRFPMLTMRVKWNGQQIPLIKWRTTIGGWRSDLASNGYEYFRYKGSDVGPRVWRNIVSGPVWIAPTSTPLRTLVKSKRVNNSSQYVVNYDEVGPGYLSAYGLIAAYNVVPGKDGRPDWDNGVRVHGSSEYLSIRNPDAYSHGCHRLMNHLAVRMFSFVLRHRNVKIIGERALGFARQFLWKDDVFEMRLPSRGFHWELDPPLPVNVLEGNIRGKAKKPILTYMPKPDVVYPPGPPPTPPDLPESRAGGGE